MGEGAQGTTGRGARAAASRAQGSPRSGPETPPRLNLADRIFEQLQRRILSDAIAPGERLPSERVLAQQLDTNRNTLREAIRKLEQRRLVRVRHGQGVTVRDFRQSALMDVLEPFLRHGRSTAERVALLTDLLRLRRSVMIEVVRFASERATAEDHARLAAQAETQLAAFEARDGLALARGDVMWLDALVDAAHSLTMRWVANTILDIYRGLSDRLPQLWLLEPSYPAHMRALVEAIASGDGEAASRSVGDYFARNDARVLALLDQVLGDDAQRRTAASAAAWGGEAAGSTASGVRATRADGRAGGGAT